ncbi:MAG: ComF family protein [Elainellaceae cyanobacterium]
MVQTMVQNYDARWARFHTSIFNLFLESRCALCERSSCEDFCPDCQRQIQQCQISDRDRFWHEPLPVFPWGTYSGALKRAIAALKYQQHPQLARPLGNWLGQAWLASSLSRHRSAVVVPIPMHKIKQQQRGYNQADLLARAFCHATRLPLNSQGLIRTRTTDAQFGLSPDEREQNLAHAFQLGSAWMRRLPQHPVLLLDDIYTTGATTRAAVQVLQHHGIEVCGLVALARPVYSRDERARQTHHQHDI